MFKIALNYIYLHLCLLQFKVVKRLAVVLVEEASLVCVE